MFIAAVFTGAKIWEQLEYLLMGEQMKKMWYMYAVEYYSALKEKEILWGIIPCG